MRQALIREHFFDLDDSDGEDPNFAKTTILVYAGNFKKAVDVYSWGDGLEGLRKRSRALRVLQVTLAGFDDPDLKEVRNGTKSSSKRRENEWRGVLEAGQKGSGLAVFGSKPQMGAAVRLPWV